MHRSLELILAFIMMLIFLPIMAIVALIIKLDSKGPVLFIQERFTRDLRPFNIYKFRTMHIFNRNQDKEALVASGKKDARITNIGHILRKYRIDELPQIFNILKGDMSFVGPRPQVRRYVELFPNEYKDSLIVKSGVTGLAAIKIHQKEEHLMEISSNPEEIYIKKILPHKLRYDLFYAKNRNFLFDMKIIYWTILRFFGL